MFGIFGVAAVMFYIGYQIGKKLDDGESWPQTGMDAVKKAETIAGHAANTVKNLREGIAFCLRGKRAAVEGYDRRPDFWREGLLAL